MTHTLHNHFLVRNLEDFPHGEFLLGEVLEIPTPPPHGIGVGALVLFKQEAAHMIRIRGETRWLVGEADTVLSCEAEDKDMLFPMP